MFRVIGLKRIYAKVPLLNWVFDLSAMPFARGLNLENGKRHLRKPVFQDIFMIFYVEDDQMFGK